MLKRYTIISMIILLLLTSIAAGNRFKRQNFEINLSEEISIPSADIYVDDDGGADYKKIQDAIDNASDGDVIFVFNGTYYENVKVNKKINLIGENRDITFVDGEQGEFVIFVTADEVTISGFTIKNSSINGTNICSTNCTINNNIFRDNGYLGISLKYSFKAVISDNIFTNNHRGLCLCLEDENTEVFNNTIEQNEDCGLYIYKSKNNKVYCNIIKNSKCGIIVSLADNNTIKNNSIDCRSCNIRLYRSSDNKILNNNIFRKFMCAFFTCCKNIWNGNYWGRPKLFPKLIIGLRGGKFIFPAVDFDMNPARKPCII